ncbi:autotransporter outer membrane beta-barrel domain-containing protein [Fusobacterium ulcerans]|uniref:autotransporter outer membrane beta-barrel domain-containing protein n=1 Tax=Fusobacterium ulcerans TaxID=861 RepID=UPI001D0A9B2D|nr:autotransporter outer membrane beta-barrel domain-containing protein [Fusobacterium ulcerans]MCB8564258.1 autotransporter outer membrane beta-barrel domain-containing protein [Fusobacterium ulcerans]
MIEKIMKAVKSGNKKRGRNITIGAVVGMLLSCTVAMGADTTDTEEVGLNITNNGSRIKVDKVFPDNTLKGNTYTNNSEILGESSDATEEAIGIKIEGENKKTNLTLKNNNTILGKNSLGKAYGVAIEHLEENSKFNFINNGVVSGESTATTDDKSGYGFYFSGDENKNIDFSFQNNGLILGKSASSTGMGVYLRKLKTAGSFVNFVNNGVILGEASSKGYGYGIYLYSISGSGFTLENNGLISGKNASSTGYGVDISGLSGDSFTFVNNGTISGEGETTDSSNEGSGIYLYSISGSGFTLENNGLISGKGYKSYGIYVRYNKANIETLTNNGLILSLGDNIGYGIYTTSSGGNNISSITTLENNGLILAKSTGIALQAEKGEAETLINNGSILGASSGIYMNGVINGDTASISNKGMLSTKNSLKTCNGISIDGGNGVNDRVGTLTNDGLISAKGSVDSSGIKAYSNGRIGNIISNGLILSNGIGIRSTFATASKKGKIGNIVNNGAISAEKYGIAADPSINYGGLIDKIVNTGVIYGKTNAIKKEAGTTTPGEIGDTTNYGILVNGEDKDVFDVAKKTLDNYGLTIKNDGAEVTAKTPVTGPVDVIVGYKRTFDNEGNAQDTEIKRKLNIKNAVITGGSESDGITKGTGTESFTFSDDGTEYDNSILNGMDNTLEISGEDVKREVKGSIINAYGNAVKFGEVGKEFTLSGTIVNGGIKSDTVAIKGSNGADTLILQSGEIAYKEGETEETGSQNTIINGDIDMGDGEDSITLKTDTIVNGSITMGTGADTLNIESGAVSNGNIFMGDGDDTLTIGSGAVINGILNGTKDPTSAPHDSSPTVLDTVVENNTLNFVTADSSSKEETKVFYDISNFENININSKVTFYEKTVKADDGTAKGLEVTGAKEIKIGADGTLTLRIDATEKGSSGDDGKIVGHALYGNTGTITSEGGKLLLALNGAGNEEIISFGGTTLGSGFNSKTLDTTSKIHTVEVTEETNEVKVVVRANLPDYLEYQQLNKIYHSIISVDDLINNFNVDDDEKLSIFLAYLNNIYAGNPYSYSSELSRKSAGMFRDIVVDNIFRPEKDKWMIYGGLTHIDGGTKDTYYGKGYYTTDIGSSDMDADTKITGAYMLGEYGVSDTLTSGVVIGGNKLKSDLSNGSKVDGSAMYLGAYAKKYIGNLKVTAGAGFQYGDYDADRLAVNKVASDSAESVMKYSDNYNDITYDIYLNGRYSHNIGDNLFLEPYATLSYTYIDQDGANEGNKTLAIETDSKSFDYTVGKVGVDLKKVIPHEKGKSTLSAGVSYTKILDGADEEHITGRFKGGSDFDILVAHKNEHSIGLNAKYALELENGVLFDVKGTYSIERDSHNGSGKNRTKGEWIVGAGLGYKF